MVKYLGVMHVNHGIVKEIGFKEKENHFYFLLLNRLNMIV